MNFISFFFFNFISCSFDSSEVHICSVQALTFYKIYELTKILLSFSPTNYFHLSFCHSYNQKKYYFNKNVVARINSDIIDPLQAWLL